MAYDTELAERVRATLEGHSHIAEIAMFGGLCFTLNGNMAVGVVKDELMVRYDPEDADRLLADPHTRPMDFTGRTMKGFLFVGADGVTSPSDVRRWADVGTDFAVTLPPKKKKPTTAAARKR